MSRPNRIAEFTALTVVLLLSGRVPAAGQDTNRIIITPNPAPVQEGSTVTLTLRRATPEPPNGCLDGEVITQVNYRTEDESAEANSQYLPLQNSVPLNLCTGQTRTISIQTLVDGDDQNSSFRLRYFDRDKEVKPAITINIVDQQPQTGNNALTFSTVPASVVEAPGQVSVRVQLQRGTGNSSPVSAEVSISGAQAGVDYTDPGVVARTVSWDEGEAGSEKSVTVAVLETATAGKTLRFRLTNVSGASAPGAAQQVTIEVEESKLPRLADLGFAEGTPEQAVANALDNTCLQRPSESICTALAQVAADPGTTDEDLRRLVREATPRSIAAQMDVTQASVRAHLRSIRYRLSQLRKGDTERLGTELAMNLGGTTVPVETLFKRRESVERDPLAGLFQPVDAVQDTGGSADLGGAAPAAAGLRYYLTGGVSAGERTIDDAGSSGEVEWDVDSTRFALGADAELGTGVIFGGAFNYFKDEADIVASGGDLEATGYGLTLYSMYYRGDFFFQGVMGAGASEYQSIRFVDVEGLGNLPNARPRGEPDGDQLFGALGLGWETRRGASSWSVFVNGEFFEGDIDAYVETDGGGFNLEIASQDQTSTLGELGFEYAYAARQSWGVVRPSFRLSALKEFDDGARPIVGRFCAGCPSFVFRTDEPDEDYFNAAAGLTLSWFDGGSFYVFYDTDLDRDDLDFYTLTLGLTLDF